MGQLTGRVVMTNLPPRRGVSIALAFFRTAPCNRKDAHDGDSGDSTSGKRPNKTLQPTTGASGSRLFASWFTLRSRLSVEPLDAGAKVRRMYAHRASW
jgi:hypothetical protein